MKTIDGFFLQKIEAFWGKLNQHSDMKWYRSVLRELEVEGHFNRKKEMDKYVLLSPMLAAITLVVIFHQIIDSGSDLYQ